MYRHLYVHLLHTFLHIYLHVHLPETTRTYMYTCIHICLICPLVAVKERGGGGGEGRGGGRNRQYENDTLSHSPPHFWATPPPAHYWNGEGSIAKEPYTNRVFFSRQQSLGKKHLQFLCQQKQISWTVLHYEIFKICLHCITLLHKYGSSSVWSTMYSLSANGESCYAAPHYNTTRVSELHCTTLLHKLGSFLLSTVTCQINGRVGWKGGVDTIHIFVCDYAYSVFLYELVNCEKTTYENINTKQKHMLLCVIVRVHVFCVLL